MNGRGAIPSDWQGRFQYVWDIAQQLPLWGAVMCYGVGFLLWMLVIRDLELSLAKPMLSIGFLLILLWGWYSGEQISMTRVVGTLFIVAGTVLLAKSG